MGDLLKGKIAVVTGAGRGIGRGEALALAAEGAKVVINDLGGTAGGTGAATSPADEVVAEIKKRGGEAVASYDTVSTSQGADNIIKTAVDSFGRIDILVNNAGILRDRMVWNMTDEEWDAVMKVHLYGHFYTTRAAARVMRQQKYGRIINTGSTSGLGNLGQANYSAAKEGIVGFTKTCAIDLARYGVTVNCIRPSAGTRLTLSPEMEAAFKAKGDTSAIKQLEALKPEDIAPLVVFLASDKAANINGRVFRIMSGLVGIYQEQEPVRRFLKQGAWTLEELCDIVPTRLAVGLLDLDGAVMR